MLLDGEGGRASGVIELRDGSDDSSFVGHGGAIEARAPSAATSFPVFNFETQKIADIRIRNNTYHIASEKRLHAIMRQPENICYHKIG